MSCSEQFKCMNLMEFNRAISAISSFIVQEFID